MNYVIGVTALVALSVFFTGCSQQQDDQAEASISKQKPSQSTANKETSIVGNIELNSPGVNLRAVSIPDSKAVISAKQGQYAVVSVGDLIAQDHYKVVQITHEKLILRERNTGDHYWLYLASGDADSKVIKVGGIPDSVASISLSDVSESTSSGVKGL